MRIFSHLLAALLLLLIFQACTERTICPAYQSAFIHDKEALRRQFSYFGEDSMPKVFEASKDRFLIVEPVSYHRKLRSLQTIAMTDIYPEVEDSTDVMDDEFYLAERDVTDSVDSNPADSVYVISLKKEKFNIDQELYLWYLKEYLVYPDVRLMQEQEARAAQAQDEEDKPGFFKRLFGGKKKKKEETEFDVETNATDIDEQNEEEDGKKKKGLFNFGKKKKKKDQELEDPDNESGEEEEAEEENSTSPDAINR